MNCLSKTATEIFTVSKERVKTAATTALVLLACHSLLPCDSRSWSEAVGTPGEISGSDTDWYWLEIKRLLGEDASQRDYRTTRNSHRNRADQFLFP